MITGAKFDCDKFVGLQLDVWKEVSLPEPFLWVDELYKMLNIWSWPPVGNELDRCSWEGWWFSSAVILEEFILRREGGSLCFTHLPHPSLWTLCASTPVYWMICFSVSIVLSCGKSRLLRYIMRSVISTRLKVVSECLALRIVNIHFTSASLFGYVWKLMKMSNFGRKTPVKPFWLWGVCTHVKGRSTICPETSLFSITNVKVAWCFSYRQRLASLTLGHCPERHYFMYLLGSSFDGWAQRSLNFFWS